MTHKEYTTNICRGQQRTASYRLGLIGVTYSQNEVLTDEQLARLADRFAKDKPKQVKSVPAKAQSCEVVAPYVQHTQNVPAHAKVTVPQKKAESANTFEAQILFYAPFAVNVFSIALTVCGLFKFAGYFGLLLGSMFALTLVAAVIVSRNNMKGDTSLTALRVVLWMEVSACILHPFTFYSVLPDSDILGINYRAVFALLMAIGAAYLSYNAVLFVRTYNAETE